MQVSEHLREEIVPKNILMVGPTGVGKTEISRRLAKLAKAPFIKVEATKFTEIGYVGRDVESIIRDLLEIAIASTKKNSAKALPPKPKPAPKNASSKPWSVRQHGRKPGKSSANCCGKTN